MADKNWGFKIFCECGAKYYSMGKQDNIICPTCSSLYTPEDLNTRQSQPIIQKQEPKKKIDEIDNIDESLDEDSDDIISLDDQKDIEDSNEEIKLD